MHGVNKYYGDNKPIWEPTGFSDITCNIDNISLLKHPTHPNYSIYQMDNFLDNDVCDLLIKQFDQQDSYPVGIDGFCNASDNIGSYRAMAWASEIVKPFHDALWECDNSFKECFLATHLTKRTLINDDGDIFEVPFKPEFMYKLLGSTPWLRYMKYKNGGMHTPHHDASYHNKEEQYITMFSWVLYLNTPEGEGGEFQFVNDIRNAGKHPNQWDTTDWTEMSTDIALSIEPKQGRLLIFPHWLCHQVQEYIGTGYRYIIRGDLAYGY